MKRFINLAFISIVAFSLVSFTGCSNESKVSGGETGEQKLTPTEIFEVSSFDKYKLKIKIDYPQAAEVDKVVLFVPGSGPNTYDNHRKSGELEFNYYDLFAQELINRNIAFCRYNTRGVEIGTNPPDYTEINNDDYQTYLPYNSVKDVEYIVKYLKSLPRLENARIILLGWSEGTVIAPLVALNNNVKIDSLLLAGYCNDNMKDILEWQLSGGSSMVNMCKMFDYDKKGYITKDDYETDKYNVIQEVFQNASFDEFDIDKNSKIDELDFEIILREQRENIFSAINRNDDNWFIDNYPVRLTTAWFHEHFNLSPNSEVLPKLNLPIHIFHGTCDANVPVKGVESIENKFKELEKNNLTTHIFEDHDHDLNYLLYPSNGTISEGLNSIFNTCSDL